MKPIPNTIELFDSLVASRNYVEFDARMKRLLKNIFRGLILPDEKMLDIFKLLDKRRRKGGKIRLWPYFLDVSLVEGELNSNTRLLLQYLIANATEELAGWDMRHYEKCQSVIAKFVVCFPDDSRLLLDSLITNQIPLCKKIIELLSSIITEDDYRALKVYDGPALLFVVRALKGCVTMPFLENHMRTISYRHPEQHADSYAEILDFLPETFYEDFLNIAIKVSRHKRVVRSLILAQSAKTSQYELFRSLKFLSCDAEDRFPITLRSPFEIPSSLAGDNLCCMLHFLDRTVCKSSTAEITGIPSIDELSVRAIESQMECPEMREVAIESVCRLAARYIGPSDLYGLITMVKAFKKNVPDGFLESSLDILAERQPMDVMWPVKTYAVAYGKLLDCLNPLMYTKLLSLLRRRFKEPRLSLASILVASVNAPHNFIYHALRFLWKSHIYEVELRSSFNVPSNLSGDVLCHIVCYLGQCVKICSTTQILGIPSVSEIRSRAIETQISNPKMFHNALHWRRKLGKKILQHKIKRKK